MCLPAKNHFPNIVPSQLNRSDVLSTTFGRIVVFRPTNSNGVPGLISVLPSATFIDVMNGFHCGYDAKSKNTSRTRSGEASISISVLSVIIVVLVRDVAEFCIHCLRDLRGVRMNSMV